MAQGKYELKEIRPGHFAKLVDGEVVGMASELEILIAENREHIGYDMDPGILEVALAMTSLAALLANLDGLYTPLYFLAYLAFAASGVALLALFLVYLRPRIPIIQVYYCRHWLGCKWQQAEISLTLASYPLLTLWFFSQPTSGDTGSSRALLEFGYVTLVVVVVSAYFTVLLFGLMRAYELSWVMADAIALLVRRALIVITSLVTP